MQRQDAESKREACKAARPGPLHVGRDESISTPPVSSQLHVALDVSWTTDTARRRVAVKISIGGGAYILLSTSLIDMLSQCISAKR